MTQALVPIEVQFPTAHLPAPEELNMMTTIANTLAKSVLVPEVLRNKPADVMAILLYGWEIGLKPMTALQHVAIIKGRPSPDGQALMALTKALDPSADFRWSEISDKRACGQLFRHGEAVTPEMSFTYAEAQAIGLTKPYASGEPNIWEKYKADKLMWYVAKRLCRLGAPDLVNAVAGMSVGVSEEMDSPAEDEVSLTQAAEVLQEQGIEAIEAEYTDITDGPIYDRDGALLHIREDLAALQGVYDAGSWRTLLTAITEDCPEVKVGGKLKVDALTDEHARDLEGKLHNLRYFNQEEAPSEQEMDGTQPETIDAEEETHGEQ